jgi:aminoglycoside 6'-N-acetyltransferase
MWWQEGFDTQAIEERYGPVVDGRDPTECFIVQRDGCPFGFIQRYRLIDNPDWMTSLAVAGTPDDAAGIDFFIGVETLIGAGLGPEMIKGFVGATWLRYPQIGAIVVNVSPQNRRSWRALEKAGFERAWSGPLVSDDPSDSGPSHVYVCHRPR